MNRRPAISSQPGTRRQMPRTPSRTKACAAMRCFSSAGRTAELDPGTAHAYLSDVAPLPSPSPDRRATATLAATPEAVAGYFDRVVAQDQPSTARRKLASLRSFYRALQEQGLVKPTRRNICSRHPCAAARRCASPSRRQ